MFRTLKTEIERERQKILRILPRPVKLAEILPIESIVSKIILLRGEKVLLDRDLAALYGVETKVLKQAARRNIKRFPSDFMFELSKDMGVRPTQLTATR